MRTDLFGYLIRVVGVEVVVVAVYMFVIFISVDCLCSFILSSFLG